MTHVQEEAKSLEMFDALRSSLKILKGYIDSSSSSANGSDRMSEFQELNLVCKSSKQPIKKFAV